MPTFAEHQRQFEAQFWKERLDEAFDSVARLAAMVFAGKAMAQYKPPLNVVESVDLQRYLGRCYEIVSYPA